MDEITPLFALEAEQLLLSGFTEEAIELCNKGLEVYPDYPTAKVILAKAYHIIGQNEHSDAILSKAKCENYGKVLDIIDFNEFTQLIDNNDVSSSLDSIFEESKTKELEDIVENKSFESDESNNFNEDFTNLIDSYSSSNDFNNDKNELENFNVEFINLIDSVETSSLIVEENNNLLSKIEINDFNEPIVDSLKLIENEEKLQLEDLTIANNSSKILTKNKDAFFQQEDIHDRIYKIEDSINNKIKLFDKFEIKALPKVEIKAKRDNFDNENTKTLVMGLINTRFMKNKFHNKPVEKNDDLPIYTETMAKIFTAQGANDKAINIYRKLIVSDPSKKDYYNSQIDKIKLS